MLNKSELYGKRKQVKKALSHARMQGFPTRALVQELQALNELIRRDFCLKPIYNGWSNLGPATRKRFYKQGEF